MTLYNKLLSRLKQSQQEFAVDALRRPQERDTFEYGYRVGVFAGYDAAIDVLIKSLNEENEIDSSL